MRFLFKQKARLPILAITCIMCLCSCSEEFSKWEMLKADVKCECQDNKNNPLPYIGETVLMTIESNGDWDIKTPTWISAERTSGTGNAVIKLSVSKSNVTNERKGTVTVNFYGNEESNVAGTLSKSILIYQEPILKGIKVNFPEAYLKVRKEFYNSKNYYYVDCFITYNVDYDTSDPDVAELLSQCRLHYTYGDTYYYIGYYEEDFWDIDMSCGEHTIETSGSMYYTTRDISAGYVYIYTKDKILLGSASLGKKYID